MAPLPSAKLGVGGPESRHACMREVLIGSAGGCCGAEKQPSDQTRQHQSAPVTRASTIGANIAILPAFTSGQEKRNARPRHRWAGSPIARSIRLPFKRHDRFDATRFEPRVLDIIRWFCPMLLSSFRSSISWNLLFFFFFFLSWKGDEGFNRLTYNSFQPVKDVQFCSWRNCFLVHNNTLILRFWFLGRQSCYELYSRDNVFREHCVSLLRSTLDKQVQLEIKSCFEFLTPN